MSSRSVNDSSVRQNHRRPARTAGVPNFLLAPFNADRYEFSRLVGDMAFDGDWHPAVEYLANAIRTQTGIRDYNCGEKVAHAFLAAHFGMDRPLRLPRSL